MTISQKKLATLKKFSFKVGNPVWDTDNKRGNSSQCTKFRVNSFSILQPIRIQIFLFVKGMIHCDLMFKPHTF